MQDKKMQIGLAKKMIAGFSLCLSVLLTGGMSVQAAEKETPMVNLAKGLTSVVDSQGNALTNPELLTDEDKYYLQHNNASEKNKVNGSWESYIEQGAKAANGASYIQLDLGGGYPIEVINLKRRMYDGNSGELNSNNLLRYTDTVIVIGNQEDLSDGYVVYYNDDDNSVQLPAGVTKPENTASGGMTEEMAGSYFYMDNTNENGTGYTALGTTKTARYVRIYSDHPDADEELMFMELAVYGYRSEDKIQGTRTKKVIDNENPLMIAAAYSDDQYYIGQEDEIGLQGYNTIAGRWNAVPEDLKDNTVLMMHSNNLRSFAPHHIGQATLHTYYEECLKEGYQAGASVMLMLVNASSVQNGADWCITRDADYHWADLMFRMYPNLQGVFCTENFWSGYLDSVAKAVSEYLEIAYRYGGYVVYSEDGTGVFNTMASNSTLRKTVEKCGSSLYFTYKNTEGGDECVQTQSHIIGSWLAGYTGGFGMLSDSWAWGNSGNRQLYTNVGSGTKSDWRPLSSEPETIFGMQMINCYLAGGCVYTFEFPEVVYGAVDENSPAYTHVVEKVFRYICENPGPSRADVLNSTKTMVYDAVPSSVYPKTVGEDNFLGLFENGRYGSIPSIPTWGTKEEVTNKLKETAKKEGASAPVVLSNSDSLLGYGAKKYFDSLYPEVDYLGSAFAKQYNGSWFLYNSTPNSKVDQDATLPLKAAEGTARVQTTIEPHTYVILEEEEESINISLNNYRIDASELVWNNPNGWDWEGSSSTGAGVSPAKLTVYRYMAYYNCVNAKTGVANLEKQYFLKYGSDEEKAKWAQVSDTIDQLSPADNELRTTTFTLTSLTKAPTVTVVDGQKPDTDGAVQYKDPVVTYDAMKKTATITIETNGWVDLQITDLAYVVDKDAVKIEEPEEDDSEVEMVNIAAGKTATGSHNTSSDRPWTLVTDETTSCNDYDFVAFGDVDAAVWAQVDLGRAYEINEVQMWRYNRDSRSYHDTVILLSESAEFNADSTLVIWNANRDASTTWPNSVGSADTHTLPKGSDSDYTETSAGHSFKIYGENVQWLNGSKEGVPASEKDTFKARYVRVYMNGSTAGKSNHLIEVKVMGIGADYSNLATGSSVTASADPSGDRPLSWAIDGKTSDANSFTDPGDGNNKEGAHWIQLDMGFQHEVANVTLWRYYADGRQYYNTVVLVSSDKDFSPSSTLVLYNADSNSTGYDGSKVSSWPGNGNGQSGSHSLPEGTDALYSETSAGKTFSVSDSNVKWLDGSTDRALPTETFEARYVRVYMNGNDRNASNHIVEIEVKGIPGEIILEDTEAPEKVTGAEITERYATSAVLNFLPSMDNMGVKGYEVSISKTGGTAKMIEINQTKYEITGLEADTEYTVSVVAVDHYGNKSEASDICTFTTRSETDFVVKASLTSGLYADSQSVTLRAAAGEGDIYYTLNGKDPFDEYGNPSGTARKYTDGESISINHSCILHAALKIYGRSWPTSAYFYQIGEEAQMDMTAPSAPTGVTAEETTPTQATISWVGSDADTAAFYVYVDGVKKAEVSVARSITMQTTITDLTPETAYQIYVTAVDEAGNESLRSKTIEVITRVQQ